MVAGRYRTGNDDLLNRRINNGKTPGEFYRNVYPLFVNKTVYEGLRKDDPDRRAMILTRSGFSGIQRYGAVTWSGDVGNDWETLRRQIAGGLGQMATGLPWWTYDAGGFSVLPTSIRIKITRNECCVGYRPEPSCH